MMSTRPLILLCLGLLLIVFYFDSYYIAHTGSQRIIGSTALINIESDFTGTIIWILIAIFPIFIVEHYKGENSYVFKILLFAIYGTVLIIAAINSNNYKTIIALQPEFIQAIFLSLMVSTNSSQLISIYQQIRIQNSSLGRLQSCSKII